MNSGEYNGGNVGCRCMCVCVCAVHLRLHYMLDVFLWLISPATCHKLLGMKKMSVNTLVKASWQKSNTNRISEQNSRWRCGYLWNLHLYSTCSLTTEVIYYISVFVLLMSSVESLPAIWDSCCELFCYSTGVYHCDVTQAAFSVVYRLSPKKSMLPQAYYNTRQQE